MSKTSRISKTVIAAIVIVIVVVAGAGSYLYYSSLGPTTPTAVMTSASSVTYSGTTSASSVATGAPVTLQVYMVAEPGPTALQNIVSQFTAKTGINVQLNTLPYATLQVKQASILSAKSPSADVVLTDDVWRGQYVGNNWVVPLTPYITRDGAEVNMSDFIPGLVSGNMEWQGTVYGLGFISAIYVAYYRTDIFAKYGLTPDSISTWDGMYTTAQFLQGKLAGTGVSSIDIMGARGVQATCAYFNFLGAYGGRVYNDTYWPEINSTAAIAAAQMEQKLGSVGASSIPSDDYGEVQSNFATGRAAMVIGWQNMAPAFADPSISKIIGEYKAVQIPGVKQPDGTILRTPTLGGWAMDISAFSTHQEQAWQFVKWATSSPTEIYASKYEDMDRYSSWNAPELATINGPYIDAAVADLKIAFARPAILPWPAMSDMMGVSVNEYLTGALTATQAMNTLQLEYLSYLADTGYCTNCPVG
jgi:multiple sugar transport system substrate-binding protein